MLPRSAFPPGAVRRNASPQGGLRPGAGHDAAPDPFALDRERMVGDQIERRGIRDPGVLRVMRELPRHLFVPAASQCGGVRRLPAAHRSGPDHLPALHRRVDDRAGPAGAGRDGAGDRHRLRLSDGSPRAPGAPRLQHRAPRGSSRGKRPRAWPGSASPTSPSGPATAARAGRSTRPSTSSWPRRLLKRCRRLSSNSCAPGVGWSSPRAPRTRRNCCGL